MAGLESALELTANATKPGSKLITPFGIVGRFARQSFRQRLREHYYGHEWSNSVAEGDATQPLPNVALTRFLLDYVLDMGPAAPLFIETGKTSHKPSSASECISITGPGDTGGPSMPALRNSSAIEQASWCSSNQTRSGTKIFETSAGVIMYLNNRDAPTMW